MMCYIFATSSIDEDIIKQLTHECCHECDIVYGVDRHEDRIEYITDPGVEIYLVWDERSNKDGSVIVTHVDGEHHRCELEFAISRLHAINLGTNGFWDGDDTLFNKDAYGVIRENV